MAQVPTDQGPLLNWPRNEGKGQVGFLPKCSLISRPERGRHQAGFYQNTLFNTLHQSVCPHVKYLGRQKVESHSTGLTLLYLSAPAGKYWSQILCQYKQAQITEVNFPCEVNRAVSIYITTEYGSKLSNCEVYL